MFVYNNVHDRGWKRGVEWGFLYGEEYGKGGGEKRPEGVAGNGKWGTEGKGRVEIIGNEERQAGDTCFCTCRSI